MKKMLIAALCAVSVVAGASTVYAEETTIDEQVLYDEGGIKVTAKGFTSDEWYGACIPVLIENNSDQNICMQVRHESINGCMVDFQISAEVAAGKKANDKIIVYRRYLDDYGITQVADIECSLLFFNPDNLDTIADSSLLSIETNLTGKYEQEYNDSGEVVFDQDNIKIVAQGVVDDDTWGLSPVFYIENNSDQEITVQLRDTSINGFMVDPTFSSDVMPGKRCVDGARLLSSDLEQNGIDSISTLETSFHIFPADDFAGDSIDSPAVTINY